MAQRRASAPGKTKDSFAQRGYDHLIAELLEGRLQPGDEINRRQLAEALGVSIAPINEAVAQLEAEGFLEIAPRKSTRVRVVKPDDVRGLMILREALECQAARLYCGEPVRRERRRLKELAREVDATQIGSRENELAEGRFHGALVELTEVGALKKEFDKVMRRNLFFKINMLLPEAKQPPLDSHLRLLDELQLEDADAAEQAMRRHLERGRSRLLNLRENQD